MKKLPTLTFLIVASLTGGLRIAQAWQSAEEASGDTAQPAVIKPVVTPNPRAEEVVRQAREGLLARESVQADLSQQVSLNGFRFQSSGKLFAGPEFRFRLEYEVQLADLQGSFLEICDGQVLHTRRQIAKKSTGLVSTEVPDVEFTRRDIQKILRETGKNLDKSEVLHAAEIGIGGLPAVLASLERSMVFDAIREVTEDGKTYQVVQGRWNESRREELLTRIGGLAGQVAGFMPDMVRVYFEQESLFPERFQYLKQVSPERETYRPILTVQFDNIRFNEPIPPQAFIYVTPQGVEERDETTLFLNMIKEAAAGTPAASDTQPAETTGTSESAP